MKQLLWCMKWALKAAIFFTLLAFALNNQQDASVHFFFGHQWQAPLVLVVLCAFAAGVAVGVLGMVPRWWRHRRAAMQMQPDSTLLADAQGTPATVQRAAPNRAGPTIPPDVPHGI